MLRHFGRALAVFLICVALMTSLPMSSPDAKAARVVTTFDDGTDTKIIEFTTDPLPGERATVFIKLRGDVVVTQAVVNVSADLLERSWRVGGTGLLLLSKAIDLSGDFNGDGLNDLVVSAPGTSSGQGFIAGLVGRQTGFQIPPQDVTISGTTNNDYLGWALTMGDINADGVDDIVSSRIKMDFNTNTGTGVGDVVVYYGGNRINATPDKVISYGNTSDMFGWAISCDGDINGDGYDDLVASAPRHVANQDDPGRVHVFLSNGSKGIDSTTPNQTVTGTSDGDVFGNEVRICGDVNDDGYDDVLVGAPGHNGSTAADWDIGRAYLYLGSATGIRTTPAWTYTGEDQFDLLGYTVCGIDDTNDDGYGDIAVGVPLWEDSTSNNTGAVLVFYGSASGPSTTPDVTIEGDVDNGILGAAVANSGDINGDGLGDLLVGAPDTNNGSLASAGHVQVHFGTDTGLQGSPAKVLRGWEADGDMGITIGPGGDGTGDGCADIIIGDTTRQFTYVYYGGRDGYSPTMYVHDVEVWTHAGSYMGKETTDDFADELNAYLMANQDKVDLNGDILVPLNFSMGRRGKVKVDALYIQFYRLVQPTGLTASAVPEGNAIRLRWDRHDTKQDDISKMAIEMWNGTGWEEMVKVAKNAVEYVVTGLTDGVEYKFRIRAFDGGVLKYSEPSIEVTATPMDTKAPDKVIDVFTAEDRELMGINISWAPSDPDVVNYEVWTNKSGAWDVLANVSAPQTWFVDTDVLDGPKYYYRVRAWDEVPLTGELSVIRSGVLSDLDPPATPMGLAVETVATGRALRIVWDLNTDDTVSYSVKSNWSGPWKEIGSKPQGVNYLVHTGLVDGKTYYYRISALDEVKNEANWSEVASGVPVDETPPAAPTGLEIETRPQGNVLRIKWTLNTDDTDKYEVQVFYPDQGEWVSVIIVAREVSQYDIVSLTDGVTYRIRIRAIDKAEIPSPFSQEVTGVPVDTLFPSIPKGLKITVIPEGTMVNISWDANTDDTVMYRLYQWSPDDKDYREVLPGPGPETWYLVVGLRNNVPYAFVVRAVDEAGNESPNSLRVEAIPRDTVPPAQPRFEGIATITNLKDIDVVGVCEPGVTIVLFVRNLPSDPVPCDEQGRFSIPVRLNTGPNEIYAQASDDSGVMVDSARVTIKVDLEGPTVERTDPPNESTGVSRANLTIEVRFTEELRSGTMECFIHKGKVYDVATLMANKDDPANMVPRLTEYDRIRSVARYTVDAQLEGGQGYTIVVHGAQDLAGNLLAHPSNAYAFVITTAEGGGGGGGGGGGDEGVGTAGIVGVVILVILVVIVVLFLVIRSSGTTEAVEVDRDVMAAPARREVTPEEARPDISDLYAQAYTERGEDESREHAPVADGLGDWLAEQERHSAEADEETKRLVAELAKQAPPLEDTGPIDEVPPGLLEQTEAVREELGVGPRKGEAPEGPTGDEGSVEDVAADEDANDEAAAVLEELEEELEPEEEDKEG